MADKLSPWDISRALVQRGELAQSNGGTLDDYIRAVAHPLESTRSRDDLIAVIAYLTAQLVGAHARLAADELTTLLRVEGIIKDWREREARALAAEKSIEEVTP